VPSSGSVAEPLNEMRSPTFQVVPAAGVEMTGVGGLLATLMVFVAVPLSCALSVTRRPTTTSPGVE
jgi:hypothetical protein